MVWVRIHINTGLIGLGETFYGAGAVEAQIHGTLASRLLGRDPLRVEAIHPDMASICCPRCTTVRS